MIEPVSNPDELASIQLPLKACVVEVFSHLVHCPHTPDGWKRDLDKRTQVLLDRVDAALERVRSRQGLMRIPVEATDIDVVLSDCREEINRLRADLAQRTAEAAKANAERDEARQQVFKTLKAMYTTAGLRRELLRRGWWEWYKEVRP